MRWTGRAVAVGHLLLAAASPLVAQTDYFNLDKNRPVRIEDAYATERYAFELKVAPLRLERSSGGVYHWGIEPELAYGILPRTQIALGVPFSVVDAGDTGRRSGFGGIELSILHNLNNETQSLPALAIKGDLLLPTGPLAPDRTYPAVTGIATRSTPWARIHANVQYTFGSVSEAVSQVDPEENLTVFGDGVARWLAGVAIDRVYPLSSLLLVGDVYALQPVDEGEPIEWNAGVGFRYQVNPYLAIDAGIGSRLTGDSTWYVTFGSAFAFGLRRLIPIFRSPVG